jgi:hypothetical protein
MVVVDNNSNATSYNVITQLPSGDSLGEDLSDASFTLQNTAKVGLIGDTEIEDLSIDGSSTLIGNDYTLTLNSLSGTGTVDLGTSTVLNFNNSGSIGLSGVTLSGTGTITQSGTGVLTIDSDYAADLTVEAGVLRVDSGVTVTGDAAVNDGGVLQGEGTIAGIVTVNNGGTLAPGASPGVLTVDDLVLGSGGAFSVELEGLAVGSEYDQLVVNSTVDLGGDLLISTGGSLNLFDTFTIIDYPVGGLTGGFTNTTNLAGLEIVSSLDGGLFSVDYVGAGSEVILQKIPEPASLSLLLLGSVALLRRRRR